MYFSFNAKVAKKYGVNEAVFIQNLYFWIKQNKANNKHFHNGRYWTYNSADAMTELFPFWSIHQIKRIVKKLEETEIILLNNFNRSSFDRTNWYALSDEIMGIYENELKNENPTTAHSSKPHNGGAENTENCTSYDSSVSHNGQHETALSERAESHFLKERNRTFSKSDIAPTIPYPITDSNTDSNTDINILEKQSKDKKENFTKKQIENFWESIWKLYPNKKGKGAVSQTQKAKLFAIGEEKILLCIKRYEENKEEWREYQNGSTFFNSGYIDYLEENYSPTVKEKPQTQDYSQGEDFIDFIESEGVNIG